MKKWGFMLRLKYALWDFYNNELFDTWSVMKAEGKTYIETYQEECDDLIKALPQGSRDIFKKFLEKKAVYLIREGTAFIGQDQSLINKSRLFQTILLKQTIERIEKEEKKEQEKSAKKISKK